MQKRTNYDRGRFEKGGKLMKNVIHFYITDHCSTSCPFCGMTSGPLNNRFIDVKKISQILDLTVSSSCANVVRMIGGEPLVHPKFEELLKIFVMDTRIDEVEIITNGIGLDKKLPFISEMSKTYGKRILVRLSINYWLLSVNSLLKKTEIEKITADYKNVRNLKFSANIGIRVLPEDEKMLAEWRELLDSLRWGISIVHLAAYISGSEKKCPGLRPYRKMICPHLDVTEFFVSPDGNIFHSCDEVAKNMQMNSKYYGKR